jgi:hypothetical protein
MFPVAIKSLIAAVFFQHCFQLINAQRRLCSYFVKEEDEEDDDDDDKTPSTTDMQNISIFLCSSLNRYVLLFTSNII